MRKRDCSVCTHFYAYADKHNQGVVVVFLLFFALLVLLQMKLPFQLDVRIGGFINEKSSNLLLLPVGLPLLCPPQMQKSSNLLLLIMVPLLQCHSEVQTCSNLLLTFSFRKTKGRFEQKK